MEYVEHRIGDKTVYVRRDRVEELSRVDVVVFDCDGVLLDIRESYIRAVAETTRILVEAFTGADLPESLFDGGLNYAYKRRGGFNNDWSLTYALVMRVLSESPEADLIKTLAEESTRHEDIYSRYRFIAENRVETRIQLEGLHDRLLAFSELLDESGVESVDRQLLPGMAHVKEALAHPGSVGESIISTLFEELLSGAPLYRETFGAPARFTDRLLGYVENERKVITDETLDAFESLLGGPRLGVASGSIANTARHALGDIVGRFTPAAQVWNDDVAAAEESSGRSLHKPNPYSLLRAAGHFSPYEQVLYVGDTSADRMMAERAGQGFLFAGVYGSVAGGDEVREAFLREGCDVVAPTVNELPAVLGALKGPR
ncbi:HAD-IA family hydrolase [Candidatus Bathyarchaeota archaeon]|nr:HAD-IA family hydrolase [Candidatus Bathyarchaeota archaeon]